MRQRAVVLTSIVFLTLFSIPSFADGDDNGTIAILNEGFFLETNYQEQYLTAIDNYNSLDAEIKKANPQLHSDLVKKLRDLSEGCTGDMSKMYMEISELKDPDTKARFTEKFKAELMVFSKINNPEFPLLDKKTIRIYLSDNAELIRARQTLDETKAEINKFAHRLSVGDHTDVRPIEADLTEEGNLINEELKKSAGQLEAAKKVGKGLELVEELSKELQKARINTFLLLAHSPVAPAKPMGVLWENKIIDLKQTAPLHQRVESHLLEQGQGNARSVDYALTINPYSGWVVLKGTIHSKQDIKFAKIDYGSKDFEKTFSLRDPGSPEEIKLDWGVHGKNAIRTSEIKKWISELRPEFMSEFQPANKK